MSSLDTSKLDQNQNDLIDACGSIADYVDAFSMIQKQELIDRWLLEKRLNERGFRFAEIRRETAKNQLRDQIQKKRYFKPIKKEIDEINREINEIAKEVHVFKELNSLEKTDELRAIALVKKLKKEKQKLENKFMTMN